MKVLVTGGRGVLGRMLTPRLGAAGHEVVVSSRKEHAVPEGPEIRVLDLTDASSTEPALDGIDTVLHAASNAARSKTVDIEGTARLLEAAERAGVGHVVYISIVGVDQHPFPYYRAKLTAEGLVSDSATPDSILRATQFHEFLDRILASGGPIIPVFRGFEFQVIDSGAVADRLVALVDAGPQGRVDDIGGPRSEPMHDMAHSWKHATGSAKAIMPIPVFGRSAQAFRSKAHHTPNTLAGTTTWDDYLAAKYG
jgi:uncharacterized protein YbjT (DUF2867 family)